MRTYDATVLIIGAGAAGLMAASKLHEAGVTFFILEARTRWGGRLWTDCREGHLIELGAEFVHGRPKESFNLIKAHGLPIVPVLKKNLMKNQSGFSSAVDFWSLTQKLHQQLTPTEDINYSSFLKKIHATPTEKKEALYAVEGFAADPDLMGTQGLLIAEERAKKEKADHNYHLASGYHVFLKALASSLPLNSLQLEHIVHDITWEPHHIEVSAHTPLGEKKYRASQLLITVPLGVLQAKAGEKGALRFSPSLFSKEKALSRLQMGHALKCMIIAKKNFWQEQGKFGFLRTPEAKIRTWWTQEPLKTPILTAWQGGPLAEKILSRTSSHLKKTVLDALSQVFSLDQKELSSLIQQIHWHDWSHDPFSRGAYSYPGVGGLDAARQLAEPIANTLFFAGEATDFEGRHGTVHGALASGLRAAKEILIPFQ